MDYYEIYEPYHQINAEYWKLRKAEERNGKALGFGKKSRAEEYRRGPRVNPIQVLKIGLEYGGNY